MVGLEQTVTQAAANAVGSKVALLAFRMVQSEEKYVRRPNSKPPYGVYSDT